MSQILLTRLSGDAPSVEDLEDCLEQLLHRCHTAWPGLSLPVPIFLSHLAAIIDDHDAPGRTLALLHAEDLYLACACAHGVAAAHAAFDRDHLSQVPLWLSGKTSPAALPALSQEVQQRLRERLLCPGPHGPPRIASYGGQGKLQSWVRIACLRVAANLQRSEAEQRTEVREPSAMELVSGEASPELEWMKTRYRQEFEDAFRAALLSLSGEQLNLLRLHLVAGLSIDKLVPLFHLSRATMARRLQAARQAVLEQTERLLKERLGVSAGQVRSLARALRSQVDISLYTLLSQRPPQA